MITYSNLILYKTNISPSNILEIGSRDGHCANIIRNFFGIKNEKVYLVEPNPTQIAYIKNVYPNVNLHEVGISSSTGTSNFYQIESNSINLVGCSSMLDRNDSLYSNVKVNNIKINTLTGKDLLKLLNEDFIDLCKIDVEGMTFEVLKSFGSDINKIKSMHIETEDIQYWKDQILDNEINDYLLQNGFVKIYKDSMLANQYNVVYVQSQYLK